MKNLLAFITILLISMQIAVAQYGIVMGVPYEQISDSLNNPPLKYDSIREPVMSAQISFKRIYRKDSLNLQLFEPKCPELGYMSFFDLIIKGVYNYGITPYSAEIFDRGNEFNKILTEREVNERTGTKIADIEIVTVRGQDTVIPIPYKSWEIESYLLKQVLLYNSAGDLVQSRTIGLCPIRRDEDYEQLNPLYSTIFWIYYPELQLLAANQNMISLDSTKTETFDDFIFNEKYNGEIYKDSAHYYHFYKKQPVLAEKATRSFLNLYSDQKALNTLLPEIIPVEVENENYTKIKGRDFKKAKIVYTKISQTGNENLFLPFLPEMGYRSFIDVILNDALHSGKRCYKTHNLKEQLTIDEINTQMEVWSVWVESYYPEEDSTFIEFPYTSKEITKYQFKELWLYDKKGNIVDRRILSICPLRKYYTNTDFAYKNPLYLETFWIDFSEYTNIFKQNYVTQTEIGMPVTFNNYFVKNMHKTKIISEEEISKREAKEILKNK